MPPDIHHWNTAAFLCCSNCRSVYWYCPQCGQEQGRQMPEGPPAIFPVTADFECSRCSAPGTITVLGWSPAEALQQALDLPAAQRPQPPAKSRKNSSRSQQRLPLRQWRRTADPALRRRLQGVSAQVIGEAHRSRGLEFQYVLQDRYGAGGHHRTYSRSELIAALDFLEQEIHG